MERGYDVGLDIGTNSLGWAVISSEGVLEKFKGKSMWGSVLFDEGLPASERRAFRSARRRIARRKQRILWLQELMTPIVLKEDPDFFLKLKYSYISPEDDSFNASFVFSKEFYKQHKFYQEYPTIYHLRKALMSSDQKMDPRLIYLALHHIIKYRGNFLYPGQQISVGNLDIEGSIQYMLETFGIINADEDDDHIASSLADALVKENRKGEKKDECVSILLPVVPEIIEKPKDFAKCLVSLLLGYKGDLAILLGVEDKLVASFADETYLAAEDKLDDEQLEKLESLQKVYSGFILLKILSGNVTTLSDAYIAKYDAHKEDLSILKALLKVYAKDEIDTIINDLAAKSYAAYVKAPRKCKAEDMYKAIKAVLQKMPQDDVRVKYCLDRIEDEQFLVKPRNSENGAIPNQLHIEELEKILANQSRFYPELEEVASRILSIAKFRIPYYIGPLNGSHSWAVRKEEGKIYPWNIYDKIDKDASATSFIKRMTNKCTYLYAEDVLPKYSLLLEEFNVLNELANIRIDGNRLSSECKLAAVVDLFSRTKKVSRASFLSWMVNNRFIPSKNVNLSGLSAKDAFISTLSSFIDFTDILGPLDAEKTAMAEDLVVWITLFEDKDMLERKIRQELKTLSDEQVKKILKLRYSSWGRLSRKLLDGIHGHDQTGRPMTILQVMRETSMNFMEVLADESLGFSQIIDEENSSKESFASKKDLVMSYPGSPALKKATWVAVRVIDEIGKIMKEPPRSIYIEVAGGDEDKKRTSSRYAQLEKKLKAIKDSDDYKDILKELQSLSKDDKKKLVDKRLMLYFLQNGKSMYSGKRINLNEISLCQVDHIIPQCYIKDDSLDNLALVYTSENQRKKDSLLLDDSIIKAQEPYWRHLLKYNLISRKKYENLIRREVDENAMKGFIARQLVETRQISKYVFESLKEIYPDTDIYGISAKLSSNVRSQLHLPKVRELNDLHHAQDAMIAAKAGFFVQKRFSQVPSEHKEAYSQILSSPDKERKQRYGMLASLFEKAFFGWNGDKEAANLRRWLGYKDYFLNRLLEENTSEFYNQILMSRNENPEKLIPKKKNQDPNLYGGYTGEQDAYFCIVSFLNGKKTKLKLIGIPVRIAALEKTKANAIQDYLQEQGYNQAQIIKDHILKYQHVLYHEGDKVSDFYLVGSGEVINARQLMIPMKTNNLLSRVLKASSQGSIADVDLQNLYSELCEKMKMYVPYQEMAFSLEKLEEAFMNLPFLEKVETFKNMLVVMQANSGRVEKGSWKLEGEYQGEKIELAGSRLSKVLKPENIEFVYSSITGMFTKSERL
jgi:CRISPR-associated endonuclease Csn1